MVKRTQAICWLFPTNYLSVFDQFMRLALKMLKGIEITSSGYFKYFHQAKPIAQSLMIHETLL